MILSLATDSDAHDIARIVVQAFDDKFRILFGSHLEEACRAMAAELRTRGRAHITPGDRYLQGVFVALEQEQIVGVIACRMVDSPNTPLLLLIRTLWRDIGPWRIMRALLGLALFSSQPSSDECYIEYLAVRPGWQRRGIGTALLSHAQKYARTQGKRRLTLEVSVRNEGALRLYKRLGFSPVRCERNYFTHLFFSEPYWLYMEKYLPLS